MVLSNELSRESGSFPCCLNPHRFLRGFEALFPCTGTLIWAACFALQLFLPVYLHVNVGLPCLPAATSLRVLSAQLCIFAPPTGLDECFFFTPWLSDFHTVQISGSSGYFLFLNLLLSFFWLCEEAKCIYLCLHLGQKFPTNLI